MIWIWLYFESVNVICIYACHNFNIKGNIPYLKLDWAALTIIDDMSNKRIAKRAKNDFNLEALKRVVIFNNMQYMYDLLKNIVFIEKRRCLEADDHPFAD